jgi:hypothetical protein
MLVKTVGIALVNLLKHVKAGQELFVSYQYWFSVNGRLILSMSKSCAESCFYEGDRLEKMF